MSPASTVTLPSTITGVSGGREPAWEVNTPAATAAARSLSEFFMRKWLLKRESARAVISRGRRRFKAGTTRSPGSERPLHREAAVALAIHAAREVPAHVHEPGALGCIGQATRTG